MPSVAEQLRQAREGLHLTVEQVADLTKIRTDHVRALDVGDYRVFPAPVYIRGFTRSYASVLKLDVPKLMAELELELSLDKRFSAPPKLDGEKPGFVSLVLFYISQINWKITLAVALLAIMGLLFYGWQRHQDKRREAERLPDLGPGVYEPARKHSGETLPLPALPGGR